MADINFSELGLKVNSDITSFDFNGKTVEIKKYISVNDKYDLIMVSLQKAKEEGTYNDVKLDVFFHLNLIYLYSNNIIFEDADREDETYLYDKIKSSGFLDAFLEHFDKNEYDEIIGMLDTIRAEKMRFAVSTAAILKTFTEELPAAAEKASEFMNEFDPEKYQKVIQLAKDAGQR